MHQSTPATPRAPRRDATANRAALLDAAVTVLQRDPNASLEAIAAEAGLSRRAVYGHFSSRDDLLRELVERGAERIVTALPTAEDLRDHTPVEHIAVLAAALWSEVAHARTIARLAVRGPLGHEVWTIFAPVRAQIRDACERGIAEGTMRADINANALSRLIESACLAVLDETTESRTPSDKARSMVVVSALGIAGIDWRSAIAAVPPAPTTTEGHS